MEYFRAYWYLFVSLRNILTLVLILFPVPGAADEASVVFGEAAALCVQKQYQIYGLTSQKLHVPSEDHNLFSGRNYGKMPVPGK